jgi:hypothetical protein
MNTQTILVILVALVALLAIGMGCLSVPPQNVPEADHRRV